VTVRKQTAFAGVRSAELAVPTDLAAFPGMKFASHVIAPAGTSKLPSFRIANRDQDDYQVGHYNAVSLNGHFPSAVDFPAMVVTQVVDACCPRFGAPFLPASRQIITDYLLPWEPESAIWFSPVGGDRYQANTDLDTDNPEYVFDTAFYLDSAVSKHYGHFIFECLSRIYALSLCRSIYDDIKVVIANEPHTGFQIPLLKAAGVPSPDIVKFNGIVRCKRLLLATPSLGLGQYSSPTALDLCCSIRDHVAVPGMSTPDRIYLSRTGIEDRKLVNEAAVEQLFERLGFAIIRPETYPLPVQVTLLANARLVAGPSGSGLFNLAFEGRMRSVFILVWEEFMQLSEMLIAAGHNFDLWYHLGVRLPRGPNDPWGSWTVDLGRLQSDVADWLALVD